MSYTDKYGVDSSDDKKSLIRCPKEFKGEYIIPSSVTSIGDLAFSHCTGLTSIIINYSEGCDKVRLNYFNHIGRRLIKYVTISDGITLIPEGLFADAESLEMVYLSNTLTALPDKTFYNCSRLEELKIPDSVMSIGNECIVGCNLLKDIVIPEGVETLGDRAICDCEGLESVTLPSTVKRIGTGFLSDCPIRDMQRLRIV